MPKFSVIYHGTVTHDALSAVHVQGQMDAHQVLIEQQIKDSMVWTLLHEDIPDAGWTKDRVRVVEFFWSDVTELEETEAG